MSRSFLHHGLLPGLLILAAAAAGCGISVSGSPNPAATVNGHDIPMVAYHTQVSYMEAENATSIQFDPCKVKSTTAICQKLKQTALQNLIYEELVREYATTHHITVSATDFNAQWTVVFQNRFHGNMPVTRAYARSIGIQVSDLKNMIREDLLQQQVMYRVTAHMPLTAPAVHLAKIIVPTHNDLQSVYKALRSGETFFHVARRLSLNLHSLCAQDGCGEVGWVPVALLPGPEQRMTAPAAAGAVVGPIVSQQGLTLFLVEGHQARWPLNATQQLSLREQMFTQWLAQRARQSSIHRYVTT